MPYDYEDTRPLYPSIYQGARRRRGVNLFGSGSAVPAVPDDQLDDLENMPGYEQAPGSSGVNEFAQLAGLAAQAISPNSWGGRLGRNMASLAMRNQNRADPYNQMLFQSRMAARGERERQKQLEGVFNRLKPTTRMGVGYGTPVAPGASPSAFGVPPVTTSLEEQEQTSHTPASMADIASLVGILGPQGAKALMEQSARFGNIPLTPKERAAGYKPTSAGGSQFNVMTGQYEGGQAPQTNVQLQVRPGGSIPPSPQYPGGYTAPLIPSQGVTLRPGERGPFGVSGVTPQEPVYSPGQIAAGVKEMSPGTSPLDTATGLYGLTAPRTPSQEIVTLGPGASALKGGKIIATAPQTGRQQAPGVGAGGGKVGGEKLTDTGRAIAALAREYASGEAYADQPASTSWWGGGKPALSRQERAKEHMNKALKESDISFRRQAYQQAFGGGQGGATAAPSKPVQISPSANQARPGEEVRQDPKTGKRYVNRNGQVMEVR